MHFTGTPVSEGLAVGLLYQADVRPSGTVSPDQVAAAFAAVAAERAALADRLRAAGRNHDADIVGVAALIAADPVLVDPAVAAVRAGADAVTAVTGSAEAQAAVLAALPTPELADRATDVRQVGQAVLEQLAGGKAERPAGSFILVRREVAAADLVELAEHGLAGAVSVAGGASSHAAIIARGLGLPMLTGVDDAVLTTAPGQLVILDAAAGELTIDPAQHNLPDVVAADGQPEACQPQTAQPLAEQPTEGQPAVAATRTADGVQVTILCNVASPAETRRGLAAGAAGVGLLRTEIAFTTALAWPTAEQHARQLSPILALLSGRPATVRLLDFTGDKIPPFLAPDRNGLAELLGHPSALTDQLRIALSAGRDTELAILIPMVRTRAEIAAVADAVAAVATELGVPLPRLGIMVELAATAGTAEAFAADVDFFSIGTNDLTAQVLGQSRLDPSAGPRLAAHPLVLALIGHVVEVALAAGISVSVCGDAAADPLVLPLLIGLGIRILSVPAARVADVHTRVSRLDAEACAVLAAKAMAASSAAEVWEMVQLAGLS
jgi:phosphoenolpyruvate-protein kinase (PTS system EI component)